MENLYRGAQGDTFDGAHQAFLLASQCPSNDQWVRGAWSEGSYTQKEEPPLSQSMRAALAILDDVIANDPIDTSRIYVTGLSMGGYGTWDALSRRPDKFAAAVPLSGDGNRDQGDLFKDIPIWANHGSTDGVVPVGGTDDVRDAIVAAGGTMEYTRIKVGHTSWGSFYDNKIYLNSQGQTIYEWLFAQSLPLSTSDYDSWIQLFPDLAEPDPNDDPDRDGLTNRVEYLFGLNPRSSRSASPLTMEGNRLHYTCRDPELTGIQETILVSTDLIHWSSASEPMKTLGARDEGLPDLQSVSVTFNERSATTLFVRVAWD